MGSVAFTRRTFEIGPKPRVSVGRCQFDPAKLISRVEAKGVAFATLGNLAERQAVAFHPTQRVTYRAALDVALHARRGSELSSGQMAKRFERGPIGDSAQHDGGGKEREESFRRRPPASAGLGEVLEAGEGQNALAPSFRDDAREAGQRRHIRQFIQGQQQPRALVVAVVGGVHELLDETHDQGYGDGLMTAGGNDVQLVGSAQELIHVKGRFAGRGACGFGAHAGKETRRRRPDAGSFAFFGREYTVQERNGGVMFPVTFAEFVYEIIAAPLVNA